MSREREEVVEDGVREVAELMGKGDKCDRPCDNIAQIRCHSVSGTVFSPAPTHLQRSTAEGGLLPRASTKDLPSGSGFDLTFLCYERVSQPFSTSASEGRSMGEVSSLRDSVDVCCPG